MAMFRRSPGSVTPFRQRREELARREAELRDGLDKLERMSSRFDTAHIHFAQFLNVFQYIAELLLKKLSLVIGQI